MSVDQGAGKSASGVGRSPHDPTMTAMSTHIGAEPGQIAPLVLLPGDPLRAQWIAETFLERRAVLQRGARHARLHRHLARPAGLGAGLRHGPAVAVDLRQRAVRASTTSQSIVRVGSCGALTEKLALRDLVIASGACTDSSMNRIRFEGLDYAPVADFGLLRAAYDASAASVTCRRARRPALLQRLVLQPAARADDADGRATACSRSRWRPARSTRSPRSTTRRALAICTVSDHIVTRRGDHRAGAAADVRRHGRDRARGDAGHPLTPGRGRSLAAAHPAALGEVPVAPDRVRGDVVDHRLRCRWLDRAGLLRDGDALLTDGCRHRASWRPSWRSAPVRRMTRTGHPVWSGRRRAGGPLSAGCDRERSTSSRPTSFFAVDFFAVVAFFVADFFAAGVFLAADFFAAGAFFVADFFAVVAFLAADFFAVVAFLAADFFAVVAFVAATSSPSWPASSPARWPTASPLRPFSPGRSRRRPSRTPSRSRHSPGPRSARPRPRSASGTACPPSSRSPRAAAGPSSSRVAPSRRRTARSCAVP